MQGDPVTPRDQRAVEQLLQQWAAIDDDAGRRAAERRREYLRRAGRPLTEYQFGERPNEWVHRDWMRPLRFLYRNIPVGVRMQIKKRLAR